jgi:hypothetical protein
MLRSYKRLEFVHLRGARPRYRLTVNRGVKKISQNVFAVFGRQLARRDSSCLTARVRIIESATKMATPTKTTSPLYSLANSPSPQ